MCEKPRLPGPAEPAADPYALAPVLIGFGDRTVQRRARVALRLALALPHLVLLTFAGALSLVFAVAGWFAALVTGQLPQFAREYLTGFMRWQIRLQAYLLLLTDSYPPLSLDDADYPVRLHTKPVTLNRASVLFRLILVLPAAVAGQLALAGLLAWSVVIWVIALVRGTVPVSVHQAVAATLRFGARCTGYALLLTAQYPAGLFGDRPPATHRPADPWTLILTGRARTLVALSLASGLLLCAGCAAAVASQDGAGHRGGGSQAPRAETSPPPGASHSATTTVAALHKAYSALSKALTAAETSARNCGSDRQCIQLQIDGIGADFTSFSAAVTNTLEGISVPAGAASAANDLSYQASQATVEFALLGQAASGAAYEREFKSGGAEQTLNLLSADFAELISALSGRASTA